jgi:hypothetical protein
VERLHKAFQDVPCPKSFKDAEACGPLDHGVALNLRKSFYHYEPEEVHYLLPLILIDLVQTRTGDDIETEDAEQLVLQLDPFSVNNDLVRENKLELFRDLTPDQTAAVCEWLRLARTWEDLKRFRHWVDAAISYWCKQGITANE